MAGHHSSGILRVFSATAGGWVLTFAKNMTSQTDSQMRVRNLRTCFVVTALSGLGIILVGLHFISLEPYFRADQIFTSVPGLSVEGQSKVETDNQVVAALRAGEKARLILFSGTGLLLLAVSCYGYRQTKKPPKAEPSGGGNPTTIRRP